MNPRTLLKSILEAFQCPQSKGEADPRGLRERQRDELRSHLLVVGARSPGARVVLQPGKALRVEAPSALKRRTHFAPTALLRPTSTPAAVAERSGSSSIAAMMRARCTCRAGAVCERAQPLDLLLLLGRYGPKRYTVGHGIFLIGNREMTAASVKYDNAKSFAERTT